MKLTLIYLAAKIVIKIMTEIATKVVTKAVAKAENVLLDVDLTLHLAGNLGRGRLLIVVVGCILALAASGGRGGGRPALALGGGGLRSGWNTRSAVAAWAGSRTASGGRPRAVSFEQALVPLGAVSSSVTCFLGGRK